MSLESDNAPAHVQPRRLGTVASLSPITARHSRGRGHLVKPRRAQPPARRGIRREATSVSEFEPSRQRPRASAARHHSRSSTRASQRTSLRGARAVRAAVSCRQGARRGGRVTATCPRASQNRRFGGSPSTASAFSLDNPAVPARQHSQGHRKRRRGAPDPSHSTAEPARHGPRT